jgi:hypothetical protein
LLLLVLPFLAGCIFDPPEECDNVSIAFRYCPDGINCPFNLHIGQVTLLVYGEDDCLVQQKLLTGGSCDGTCTTGLNLSPGSYNLVAVGNAYEKTVFCAPETMETLTLTSPQYKNGQRIISNDSLYMGVEALIVPPNDYLRDTVDFESIHISFRLLVRGLLNTATKNDDPPAYISLDNLLPEYSLSKGATGRLQTYYPAGIYYESSGIMVSEFNIFRGNDLSQVFLILYGKDDTELKRANLGLILQEAGFDPGNISDVNIPLEIVITGLEITIEVSNWDEEELIPFMH